MNEDLEEPWSVLRRSSIRASCRSGRAGRRCSPACCEREDEKRFRAGEGGGRGPLVRSSRERQSGRLAGGAARLRSAVSQWPGALRGGAPAARIA